MAELADLVHETATTTGTGNFTVASVSGRQAFNTAFGTGGTDKFYYFISSRTASEWEVGTGHLSAATTLVRDTVIASSNSNAAVDFGAGTKDVTNDLPSSRQREVIVVSASDEETPITAGTGKVAFRMPFALELTDVRASVTTAPTGSVATFDINDGGTSVLSTKLTIDAGEKTSTTAATAAVISDDALADDAEITIDFDGVGSTVAGAGVKITLVGYRS